MGKTKKNYPIKTKQNQQDKQKIIINLILILIIITLIIINKDKITTWYINHIDNTPTINEQSTIYTLDNIPEYSNKEYIEINNNEPNFDQKYLTTTSFENYSPLDKLDRCGPALANISQDIMPTEERDSIGSIKPTGWNQAKYDNVDGKYLYNRCHLIGYQLTGENKNEKNLITCTRQTNTGIMLEFENKVAKYIKETNNHVLYRSTPIFQGNNLLASGIQLEALSVEDNGKGIKFNIYIYNVQDGISINYQTGESTLATN